MKNLPKFSERAIKTTLSLSLLTATAFSMAIFTEGASAESLWDRIRRGTEAANNGGAAEQNNQNQAQNNQPRRSYLMTCRGGANSSVQIKTYGQNAVIFNFEKAPQAATAAPIQPGQCAWQDRALRPEEPTTMVYNTEGLSLNIDFNPSTNTMSDLQIINNRGNRNSTPEQFLNNIRSNRQFFVHAHRSPDGRSFTITKIGL